MYTEEYLLLIRHFRNERVTGTEMRPQLFLGSLQGTRRSVPSNSPRSLCEKHSGRIVPGLVKLLFAFVQSLHSYG